MVQTIDPSHNVYLLALYTDIWGKIDSRIKKYKDKQWYIVITMKYTDIIDLTHTSAWTLCIKKEEKIHINKQIWKRLVLVVPASILYLDKTMVAMVILQTVNGTYYT